MFHPNLKLVIPISRPFLEQLCVIRMLCDALMLEYMKSMTIKNRVILRPQTILIAQAFGMGLAKQGFLEIIGMLHCNCFNIQYSDIYIYINIKITLLRVIPTMTCWVEVVRRGLSLRI